MFERFTEQSIKVIMLAQEEARRLGHNFVGTEQILLGLIGEGTVIAQQGAFKQRQIRPSDECLPKHFIIVHRLNQNRVCDGSCRRKPYKGQG